MTPTEERLKQADHTINELNRALRNAAVWGGMEWHYNPLHPMYVSKCLDLIKVYHADKLKPAIEVFSKPAPGMVESKVTTTFTTDLCAEIDRLESQLDNITCIVAEMREGMKDYVISWVDAEGLWSETETSIPYERVNKLIADLEAALAAKENK